MTIRSLRAVGELAALADHLAQRRQALLEAWRQAVENDPELTTASSLSRPQFVDHIPAVLDAVQRKLCEADTGHAHQAAVQQSAADHGMVRWQQGYDQRELMREWSHLHLVLAEELERYADAHPEAASIMPIARKILTQVCNQGMVESAIHHAQMQQTEAAGRLQDLEQALAQLSEVERQRAELWREAAHDLRGNLGVVQSAAAGLNQDRVPQPLQVQFLALLQRGVVSLHTLLNDLLSLARLEAGQERLDVSAFDVAAMLGELCANFQLQASSRGLFLRAEGPPTLLVEGDAVKIQRISQNLLVNALKYTGHGGVRVTWEAITRDRGDCWRLCVQDTGPGIEGELASPLANALRTATQEANAVAAADSRAGGGAESAPPTLASQSPPPSRRTSGGEGIGLSIVKRLCELLDASLELETAPGAGTTFRITFPRRYGNASDITPPLP